VTDRDHPCDHRWEAGDRAGESGSVSAAAAGAWSVEDPRARRQSRAAARRVSGGAHTPDHHWAAGGVQSC